MLNLPTRLVDFYGKCHYIYKCASPVGPMEKKFVKNELSNTPTSGM